MASFFRNLFKKDGDEAAPATAMAPENGMGRQQAGLPQNDGRTAFPGIPVAMPQTPNGGGAGPFQPAGIASYAGPEQFTVRELSMLLPLQYVRTDALPADEPVALPLDALRASLAQGRASLRLSQIQAACPYLFTRQIQPQEDAEISLPFQKVRRMCDAGGTEAGPFAQAQAPAAFGGFPPAAAQPPASPFAAAPAAAASPFGPPRAATTALPSPFSVARPADSAASLPSPFGAPAAAPQGMPQQSPFGQPAQPAQNNGGPFTVAPAAAQPFGEPPASPFGPPAAPAGPAAVNPFGQPAASPFGIAPAAPAPAAPLQAPAAFGNPGAVPAAPLASPFGQPAGAARPPVSTPFVKTGNTVPIPALATAAPAAVPAPAQRADAPSPFDFAPPPAAPAPAPAPVPAPAPAPAFSLPAMPAAAPAAAPREAPASPFSFAPPQAPAESPVANVLPSLPALPPLQAAPKPQSTLLPPLVPMAAPQPAPVAELPPPPAPAAPATQPTPLPEVSLSLRAVLRDVNPTELGFDPINVPDNVRIIVPGEIIKPQLASGRVEIGIEDIRRGITERFRPAFGRAVDGLRINVPLSEVFQNLPDELVPAAEPAAPAHSPITTSPFQTPFALRADEDEGQIRLPSIPPPAPPQPTGPRPPLAPLPASEHAAPQTTPQGKPLAPITLPPLLGSTPQPAAEPPAPRPSPFSRPPAARMGEGEDLPRAPRLKPAGSINPALPGVDDHPDLGTSFVADALRATPPAHAPQAEMPQAPAAGAEDLSFGYQADPKQLALRAIFMTEQTLQPRDVVNLSSAFPGIRSCLIITPQGVTSSDHESGDEQVRSFSRSAPRTYQSLMALAESIGMQQQGSFTLRTDSGVCSFFVENGACMAVLHQQPSFQPGVREKLILVTREIASMLG